MADQALAPAHDAVGNPIKVKDVVVYSAAAYGGTLRLKFGRVLAIKEAKIAATSRALPHWTITVRERDDQDCPKTVLTKLSNVLVLEGVTAIPVPVA